MAAPGQVDLKDEKVKETPEASSAANVATHLFKMHLVTNALCIRLAKSKIVEGIHAKGCVTNSVGGPKDVRSEEVGRANRP